MSNLVSRFAENAFWLGRYVERAENLARIIDINETYARNQSGVLEWRRLLTLYADTERFEAAYGDDADTHSVAEFYILDKENSTSIRAAVAAARENARAIRHLISTEMWTHLNIFHNQCQSLTRRDIASPKLSKLCETTILSCQSFEGIAEGTFLRGEPWVFYNLGKYAERADQTTRILDMGYERLALVEGDAVGAIYWNALLRSVSGYHAFRLRHPQGSDPEDIARFLLYDLEFPRAVALCVNQLSARLTELERRHGEHRRKEVEKARRSLEYTLETGIELKLSSKRLHQFIDNLQLALADLSTALSRTYFT